MAALRRLGVWSAVTVALVQATNTQPWEAYPACPPPVTVDNTQYVTTTVFETIFYTDVLTATQPTTETQVQLVTDTVTTPTTETQLVTEIETTPTTETQFFTEIETTPTTETQLLTETETAPTTETQFLTETETTPTTQTVTETTPTTQSVTLTATQELDLYTTTSRLTSLRICPTRMVNPTFTVDVPMPTQWTWGCPPGWVCKPLQENCDFEAGLPDRNFYCAPNECVPAQALPEPLPNWNTDFSGNNTPLTEPGLDVIALPDIFNMNPTGFGLSYDIFVVDKAITITSTRIVPPAATPDAVPVPAPQNNVTRFRGRQAQTEVPAPCYTWCNNALIEVQTSGKTARICQPGSAYLVSLGTCRECIDSHRSDDTTPDTFLQIAPQFQQFMDYCDGFTTTTTTGTMTATETSGTNTFTTVVPTSSVTAIPTSDITESEVPSVVPSTVTTDVTGTSVSGIGPEAPSTYTGSEVTSLTVVVPTDGSTTTLSGSDLIGATLILPAKGASQTEIVTSGSSTYTTEVPASGAASSSLGDQTSAVEEPSDSGSATESGPAVETGNSMAGVLEVPNGVIVGAAMVVGLIL